jgi:hypothetical protein
MGNKMPPKSWFRGMNRLYAEKFAVAVRNELNGHPELIERLGDSLEAFCIWAGWERLDYEDDLPEEVDDFINKRFRGRQRMYNLNLDEWMAIRRKVFERDKFTCTYCGQVGGKLHCDHIIPFSAGGSDKMDNLTTACQKCNIQKKDKSVSDFLEWRKNTK